MSPDEPNQGQAEPEAELPPHRLDPDLAAAAAGAHEPPRLPPPVIDTRRYRWMIGIFGFILVVAFSIYEFNKHGVVSPGVPAGKHLHYFVAPLATSTLNGDSNLNPHCNAAHPNPRALNMCPWFVRRKPVVLSLFVPSSGDCVRQIDTMQAVSRQFSDRTVRFAAVAIRTSRAKAAALVHSHHWTLPVAYDRDGALGQIYGVEVCPMVELAYRGGVVKYRLTGDNWLAAPALAAKVRALTGARRS